MTRLTCKDVLEFLDDYHAGCQPPAVRARFEDHLERCPPCRKYLDSYAAAVQAARSLCAEGRGALPPDLPDDLVQAIVDAMRGTREEEMRDER